MQIIQIEITNYCHNSCSGCTQFCGHHPKPYHMDLDQFKEAIDSMAGYPGQVGIIGGEPLLHPQFEQICEILQKSQTPYEQRGLSTCFPPGKEHYREIITKTFGNVFLNDQSINNIMHVAVLVSSQELNLEQWMKDYLINKCWIQLTWSACINPHGAFFCEVAGGMSMLFNLGGEYKIEPKWWTRSPKDFIEQMEKYCTLCGAAMPLRKRPSCEEIDDVSPLMLERLRSISPKIKRGKYALHDLSMEIDNRPMFAYKDIKYRDSIAARYGMFLMINERGYQTSFLKQDWKQSEAKTVEPVLTEGR
jgi:hypothetical protein